MMINVLSTALRNAYVMNSFSAAGTQHQAQPQPAPADQGPRYSQGPHAPLPGAYPQPQGGSLPAMFGQPPEMEHRSSSTPELEPWQASQLQENLALQYARMSLDSMRSGAPSDPHWFNDAEAVYRMSLPNTPQTRHSMSDTHSNRMSLSDLSTRFSLENARMSMSESSGQPGLWQPAPNPSSAILQQRANGQDGNVFRSALYQTEAMLHRPPGQAQASVMQQQWNPYSMGPSLPPHTQPHPGALDGHEPPIHPSYGMPLGLSSNGQSYRGSSDAFGPSIRASLMDHWQQNGAGQSSRRPSSSSANRSSIDQQLYWAAQNGHGHSSSQEAAAHAAGHQAGPSSALNSMRRADAPHQQAGPHPHLDHPQAPAPETAPRSSSDSSRFSMDSLRRSLDPAR